MPPVVRPYRGISADARVAARRERLLEAGLDLLGEQGIAGVTMSGTCRRARLTDRYFYESFRNRDELLLAMLARSVETVNARIAAAVTTAGADPQARLRAALAAGMELLTDDPRQARAFLEASADPSLRAPMTAALGAYARAVAHELGGRRPRSPQDETRLELAATILVSGIARVAESWLQGTLDIPRDELIDECAHLYEAAASSINARSSD